MQATLEGKLGMPSNCPSKEAMAQLIFQHVEEKLIEVIAAADDIGKVLSPEKANQHIFLHTCASGNRLRGQMTFSWDHPPSPEDKAEEFPWWKLFGPDAPGGL
jgi:hypothetical protein